MQKPLILLLPDSFGSHLAEAGQRIWLDVPALGEGSLGRLGVDAPGVAIDGVSRALYEPLLATLEPVFEVDAFDYDWRLSARSSAVALAAHVRAVLAAAERPVHFLAHGAGGLVVLAMLAEDAELLGRLRDRRGRVVLLGAPIGGSWDVVRILAGDHALPRQIARLAAKLAGDAEGTAPTPEALCQAEAQTDAVTTVFRTWPGLLEQLPCTIAGAEDRWPWSRPTTWSDAGLTPPPEASLDAAGQCRRWLDDAFGLAGGSPRCDLSDLAIAIAGFGVPTCATAARLFTTTGDGRALANQATLPGSKALHAEASHADLVFNQDLVKACQELITCGESALLQAPPPPDEEEPGRAREDPLPAELPTQRDLAEACIGALARSTTLVFPLHVSVVHGHLRQARYPLLCGHYQEDGLVSAEAALDRALGGRLRQHFDLNVYPGPEESVEIVRLKGEHPPGAIIVGLGEVGRLTRGLLTRLVANAAVRYALQAADGWRPGQPWRRAAFSSLLVGTGGGSSVGLSDCLMAVVAGALEANRQLRRARLWDRVRVDGVEFVEIFEDVAVQAMHFVKILRTLLANDVSKAEDIEAEPRLIVRPGGQFFRHFDPQSSQWWRRIQVLSSGQGGAAPQAGLVLEFATVSDLARVEQEATVQDAAQVARLVEAAMTETTLDEKLLNAIYELLVPPAVKDRLRQGGDLILQLDRLSAGYPYELMAERVKDQFDPLAIRAGLLRQLITRDFRRSVARPAGMNMLVVGAPEGVDPPLTGAIREAFRVASLARSRRFVPTTLVGTKSRAILTEMFARDYRVLHIAAHGRYSENPLQSGVVIGKDEYLTAAHVQALQVVPDLVFLNCCHSGHLGSTQTSVPYPQLASSLAEGFIAAGVRSVIVAGWAVDDEDAGIFAEEFYGRFLDGEMFGAAVTGARQVVYARRKTNTWGAYQCYGNPDYRLRTPIRGAGDGSGGSAVSRGEYLASLRTLSARAGGARGEAASRLAAEFATALKEADSWADGEVLAELAKAAGEIENFDQAIELYEKALNSVKALAPIRAVEQLANILARLAPSVVTNGPTGPQDAETYFKKAQGWFDWLDERLDRTKEREALRGSMYKRWAVVSMGADRRRHLKVALDAYQRARQLSQGQDSYQVLNWLALRYLLEGHAKRSELVKTARTELDRATRAEAESGEPDFWLRVGIPDALLHVCLFEQTLGSTARLDEVESAYGRALATGPTGRELASVRDHVEFLLKMIPDLKPKESSALLAPLGSIARRLAR